MNSHASFDTLAVTFQLSAAVGPVTRGEVYLFSYMACLLFLYEGNPLNDWRYPFTATESGAPYSIDLDRAIVDYVQMGFLEDLNGYLSVGDTGATEFGNLSSLSAFQARLHYIEPACSSALAIPVGLVRAAVHQDPNIFSSRNLQTSRHLLDHTSLSQLHEQFEAIRSTLGTNQIDLLSPAVTWVMYSSQRDLPNDSAEDDD